MFQYLHKVIILLSIYTQNIYGSYGRDKTFRISACGKPVVILREHKRI